MSKKKSEPPPTFAQLSLEHWNAVMAIDKESDRAVALIISAFLDDMLGTLIRRVLIDDNAEVDELFDVDRPLGTFSGKIKLAYCMGLITKETYRDLDLTRRIRNDFAHFRTNLQFDTHSISQRTLAFSPPVMKEPDANPRTRFIDATYKVATALLTRDALIGWSWPWPEVPLSDFDVQDKSNPNAVAKPATNEGMSLVGNQKTPAM